MRKRGLMWLLAGWLDRGVWAVVWMAIALVAAPTAGADTTWVRVGHRPGQILVARLSTNDVWSGMLDQTPHGQSALDALDAPLVRLHVGDDGYPEAMPELTEGRWDFSALNALVEDVFASGQKPLMNIKFAPDWQWTCLRPQTGEPGTVRDLTFQQYAQYMARLVSYYNRGRMTTESGVVITNPAGRAHAIRYWEPWNEPDLNNETPCAPADGYGLTPWQYVTMWNAVTTAMLRVDPTLKFVGPATAGSQFGSSSATGNQYVDMLMGHAMVRPAAISFHGYGYWDNTVSDEWLFNGDRSDPSNRCCGGIVDLVQGVKRIRHRYPHTPVWLTEVNVNADWGNDAFRRPWSEFAAAWWASLFQETARDGAAMIYQYDVVDGPQFGLLNDQSGRPYVAYYVFKLLNQAFPPESRILPTATGDASILSLAARRPDGRLSVMVIDRKVSSSRVRSRCGYGGVPVSVRVRLPGPAPARITVQQVDRRSVGCATGAARAPRSFTVTPGRTLTLRLPGYATAVVTVTPRR